MRSVGLLLPLVTVAAATWLGDEYWTLIGPRGEPIQGDAANFARVAHFFKPQEENRFVAYWMTNTHYAGRMYEQFGEAFRKEEEDGEAKYCAHFYGMSGEAVETCENFRILTVPDRYRGQTIFAWAKIDTLSEPGDDKIGYNDHLVCGFGYEPKKNDQGGIEYKDFAFGDAVPSENVAHSVNPILRANMVNVDDAEYYLLQLLVGESTAQQNIPRLPAPPSHLQHHAHRQYVERRPNVDHLEEEQNQQDAEYARRLAEYNEQLRKQQEQSQAQDQQNQQDVEYARRLAEYNEQVRQQQAQQQQQREQYEQQQHQQQQVQVHATHQQTTDNRFICDTYGRVFEMKTGEDGRTRYHSYDLAAHGGVRPPCTLIGETAGQTGDEQPAQQLQQVQQRQEEPRPYPVRRSCTGSRQKKDADGDC